MENKMKFPKEVMKELVSEESYTEEGYDLEMVDDKIVDQSRWSVHYEMVFKDNTTGKFYSTWYSVGATECQDESPFEYAPDEIEVDEVKPVEVTVTKYVPVDE